MPATMVSLRHHTDILAASSLTSPIATAPSGMYLHLCVLLHCAGTHMPAVSVRMAAALAGKDRSTILRAIESGKLSATKSEFGRFLIEPSELERVYGALRPAPVQTDAVQEHAPADTGALMRELEHLRETLERERAHREEMGGMYERDRRAWEDERAFFRELVGKQTDQLKLLTDQRQPDARPGFWQRLMRRA